MEALIVALFIGIKTGLIVEKWLSTKFNWDCDKEEDDGY